MNKLWAVSPLMTFYKPKPSPLPRSRCQFHHPCWVLHRPCGHLPTSFWPPVALRSHHLTYSATCLRPPHAAIGNALQCCSPASCLTGRSARIWELRWGGTIPKGRVRSQGLEEQAVWRLAIFGDRSGSWKMARWEEMGLFFPFFLAKEEMGLGRW